LQVVAAGLRALPATASAFASTQAAWRFYRNDRVRLDHLAQPLIEHARHAIPDVCDDYALAVHDWSLLHYGAHQSKRDRVTLANADDLGYELLTCLAVSDRDGAPLAPVCQQLRAQAGVYTTRLARRLPARTRLDMLHPVLAHVEGLGLGKPLVHLLDAEADSIAHLRHWHRCGWRFLIRADCVRQVRFEGQERSLTEVAEVLRTRGAYAKTRVVDYHGREAWQGVAETAVVLDRPARPQRKGQKRRVVPGRPLRLRLVISEVRQDGEAQERWLLLSNVPAAVTAERLALWYFWRWRIETFFTLLKGAGMQQEHWQQETGLAVAKRLLVASMACVVVWQVTRAEGAEAEALRTVLVRLSGRQMAWGKRYTDPALLAGLWVLLSMRALLEHYDLDDLRRWADIARPSDEPPGGT
jgi:hypothetical protein